MTEYWSSFQVYKKTLTFLKWRYIYKCDYLYVHYHVWIAIFVVPIRNRQTLEILTRLTICFGPLFWLPHRNVEVVFSHMCLQVSSTPEEVLRQSTQNKPEPENCPECLSLVCIAPLLIYLHSPYSSLAYWCAHYLNAAMSA